MLPLPVMLNRANAPLAVLLMPVELIQGQPFQRPCFRVPVVFNKSAAVPMAVLLFRDVEVQRSSADSGVVVASVCR